MKSQYFKQIHKIRLNCNAGKIVRCLQRNYKKETAMWNSIDNTHPTGAILILQKWNECYKLYPYYKSDENDI